MPARSGSARYFVASAPKRRPEERPYRFVAVVAAPGHEQLRSHAQLAGPGEQTGAKKRRDARRNPQHGRRRQGVQPAAALDEREPRRLRGHQARPETQLFAQSDALRLLNQQGIGPSVDGVAVNLLAENHAARPGTGLEQQRTTARPATTRTQSTGRQFRPRPRSRRNAPLMNQAEFTKSAQRINRHGEHGDTEDIRKMAQRRRTDRDSLVSPCLCG